MNISCINVELSLIYKMNLSLDRKLEKVYWQYQNKKAAGIPFKV